MKYFTKFLCQFVSFFLVFAIGFLSCIGVVVGGVAFAYCNVSIDKLNEWGMGLDTSGIFDPKADVPVNSLTLETLLGEILGIKGNAGKYSLRDLIDRYGLVLPDEVAKYLPGDVILNTALETLISQDGLITVLKNTPLNYLLQFVPEGVISDEAKETMGNVSLYDIIFPEDEKYGSFLHGIQLGFFLGVRYEKNPDGTYTVKYADAQHPTLLELLAPIDLGLVLSLFTDPTAPESTPANVVYRSLGHIAYADLLYSFGLDISTIEIADNVLRGRSVGDLFRDDNGDGVFEFYAPGAFHDLYVGTILGTDGHIDGDTFVVNYADPDHPTILELIAPLSIGGLVSSLLDPDYGKKPLEVIFDTLGEIEFNHLFGTFLQLDKLGMEQALAGKKVKDLVTIDPDTGMPKLDVAGLFDGVFVGDFLNVKSIKNYTVDANGKKHWTYEVSPDDNSAPVAQLLAFINIGIIMDALVPTDGNFDPNKVIDATYNQVATLKFIDILHVFIPNTESITGLDKALGDKTISTVLSFNVETGEFEFHLPDVFKDIYLADFFAYPYHFDADGTFVLDCEIDHPLKLIAHISAYDFVNAIFSGDIFQVLYDTFGRIRLDDIFGLAPDLIPARFTYLYKGWKIGDFIVYNGEKWSFETKAYADALNVDRLAKDLKEEPNPIVIGFVAGLLAGRLAYLLFLNDIPFAEYVATTYNGSTLREAVDLVIDTGTLRLDRLLEDIDLSRAFAKNEKSGEYEFFWYGLIENIAFDDLVYIAFDYEKNGVDAIFGDATVGDLFVCDKDGNYSFKPENVFEFIYLDDLLNFALSFAGKDLEGVGLGGLYDSLPLASLVVDGDGKITFLPDALFLNLKEDGTAWTEFKAAVEKPTELRSLVLLGSFVLTVAVDYLLHRDDFRAIAFDDFISDYDIDSQPFADIFGGKKVGDLFADPLSDLPKSAIRFFEDVRLASVLALFGLDGNDAVNTIVSDTAFGDIVYVDAEGKIRFDGLAVVENIRFADLVKLTGYENEKLNKIIGDKRLGDLFHYDKDASPAFSFTPIKLLGDIAFRDVAEIFITVEDGTALAEILDALGTVSKLVDCDEDGKYRFTPIEWIADIRFTALIEVTKVQELIDRDLSVIFHDKTIGDVLFYEDEELRFEWFEIFRDIAFNDLIGLIGLSENIETPLCRLFTETDGTAKTVGSLLTFERGTGLKVTWYPFVDDMHVLSEVVHIIGYENEKLERLLRNITVGSIISYDEATGKVSVNEIDYIALTDLFDLILSFLGTSLAEKGIADLFDGLTVASVLTFTDGFSFSLNALEERLDRADLSGILSAPTSVRSLTVAGILLAWVLTGYFLDAETFRANAFDDYLAQFEIGSAHGHGKHEDYIANLFAGKTFGDLLPENLADFPTTLVRFFGDMSFYTPFGALKIENEHLHNLLDAFYFHNIIFVNDSGAIDFHLENLDRIVFSEILLLAGIDNETLLSIVDGMNLGGLISYNYNEKKFEFTPLGLIADVRLNAFFGFLTLDEGKREILNRMFDTRIGEILYKNEGGEIVFKPFAMTDKIVMTDILTVVGIEKDGHEDLYDLLDGKTLRDVITSDDQTLKDVSVTLFETLFGYEVYSVLNVVAPLSDPDAWEALLGHRRFSDLFSFTGLFKDFKVTFDNFFGTMKFVDIIYAATGIEGTNVKAVFGDNTIGTVLRISPEFSVEFTPFRLTDTISLNAILTLVGYENDKLTDLLEGITIADIVTSEEGGFEGIEVKAMQTLLAFRVAKVIGLFYENEALNDLLGDRRFDDLVKVTGLFEDVTVTFDDFFGTMKFADIIYAATGIEGENVKAVFGDNTIGTILRISPKFNVEFTPFKLTDTISLNAILTLVGVENDKLTDLLEGITLADIVTSEKGGFEDIEVKVIGTLLAFKVAKVIGLFYENEALNDLLGDRRFDDLVRVTGLFEKVEVTFDDFFGTMKFTDIIHAATGIEGTNVKAVFGDNTIGTVLRISPEFSVEFTPFRLTDTISFNAVLTLVGYENDKLTDLLAGITMADIVTSEEGGFDGVEVKAMQTLLAFKVAKVIGLFYENEALNDLLGDRRFDDLVKVTGLFEDVTVTFDDFFGAMKLRDIVAVFAADAVANGKPLAKILDDTCIGDILSISPAFAVKFSPFALTDDVLLTDVLAIFDITEGKIVDLLSGIRGRDLVTMENGELTVNAIGTLLAFRINSVIGLFYEEENLTRLLGDRRFDDLIKVTGLFESVEITWYDFVRDMKIVDILRACYIDRVATTVDLDELFGVKTVGDLLAQDEDGANLRLTLRRFFEDEKILGFGAILDAIGLDPDASYTKALYNLLGHKYIADLLSFDDDNNLTFAWNTFIADMELSEFVRMTGADPDGSYVRQLFGGKTLGTLVGKNADGTIRFTPFRVTDNMKIATILAMLGVPEDSKLSALLEGITLSDIVTSENGGLEGIEVNVIETLLALRVVRVIGLFYENGKLSKLLGDRRFDDLVKVTGLFEKVEVTFDDFFGTMRLCDILALAGLEGANIDALFGGKTIGTVLSITPEFVVTFTPFNLTDGMKINVILDMVGIESEKLTDLLRGLTLGDIVTSDNGTLSGVRLTVIQTVLDLSLVKLIGLFYENETLTRLLTDTRGNDKSLGTLVQVEGLFESVNFDIDAFVGNMALCDLVALTGYKNRKLDELIGHSTIGDYYSFNDKQLQRIDFITLDAVADFVLFFFNTDLYTLGLSGIIDGVKISDIAVVADGGSVSFTVQPILDNIDIDKEWQSIRENPMSLRSTLFIAAGTLAFLYLWLFDRDVILDLAFIPDLLGETEDADFVAVFGGKTVRDLVGDGNLPRLHVHATKFFAGVPLRSIAAVLGLRGQYIGSLLRDVTFDEVLSLDEQPEAFHFRPFALTDGMHLTDILGLCGIENEKLNALLDGLTMEAIVTSPHKTVYNIRINAIETLLSLRVAGVVELFYENEKLSALLGDRRFCDLVNVTGMFEKVEITFDDFFGDMKFTDILAVAGAEGRYIDELFGDSTIGTVLSITPEFKVTFTPFRLTDDMRVNTILAIFGIRDNRLTDLLDGIALSDFVTSEDGSLASVQINAIDTVLSLRVAKAIGLFYENDNLNALLGDRRFSDLVRVNGLFESVSITFDDFFGAMALRDIASVFAADMTADGQPLAAILGTTRVGDIISIPSDFRVKISPCALTDNVLLTDVLALFGIREGKIVTLLDGIRGRDLVTIEGGNFVIGAIDTVLHFAVADVIGLFYENEKLDDLLGEKQFADLVQVQGLFESVSFTFDAFFGDMKWTKILAVFGLEGLEIQELFGESTIGTVISVDANYNLILTPFLLTDGMRINTLLSIAGITDEKIKGLLAGITLGDIVTSPDGSIFGITFPVIRTLLSFRVAEVIGLFYENDKLNTLLGERRFDDLVEVVGLFEEVYVTFDRFFGDMRFTDIFAVAGMEGEYLNTLLGSKTIGTLLTVSPEFVVTFTPFAVTDDMELNVFLAMAGIKDSKLNALLEGITLGDLVTSPDGTTDQIEITAIDTLLSFGVAEVIGLFYEEENLTKLLGDRCFDDFIKVTGLFESVEITWYDFVRDMKIVDILRACYIDRVATTVDLDELFGVKTVGDLLAQDADGANVRLTLRRFFEDEKILGFGTILDAIGMDHGAAYAKALYNLLGHKYIADLLSFDDDNNLTFTWDTFIGDMQLSEFVRLAGLDADGAYIRELLGDKTLGTLVGKNADGTIRFSPFKVTDDMRINTFLMMAGIKDSKLNALVEGITLSDIITSDDGTPGTVTLNAIGTLLAFRVASVIELFYENERLSDLLGDRRFDTLLHVTGLFENVEITFDDFFGTMPITGILAVFGIEGEYIDELFTATGTGARGRVRGRNTVRSKTIGDLVKISPDFVVTFTPFTITDGMKIDTFLRLAGVKDSKFNELAADLTLSDFVTSEYGDLSNIRVNAIDTVLGLSLVKLIGLFYENAALTRLLTDAEGNDKSIGTLVQVTGLFESVNFNIDAFVGNMKLRDIVALTGYENGKLFDLLGDSTVGDYYSFNDNRLQRIDFLTLDGIVNFALSFAGTDLAALGLDGIIDGVKVSQVVTVADDGSIGFTAQPILDNIDIGREIEAITKNPTAVRSIVFAVTGVAVLTILWFADRDVLLDMAFIPDLLGETEDANLRAIFEGKTVRDLLGEGFGRLHINAVKFLAGVKFSVIPGLARFDNKYLNRMLGDTTFDKVVSVDEADQFHFRPFALTDPMCLTDILGLCGVENAKVNTLLSGITLGKIVTSPHKTVYGIRVDAVQTLLGLRVADVVAVFYEDEKLSALLGDRRFDDLVKVTGLFEKVEVTFDDFFGTMKFVDIIYAATGIEGTNVKAVFGDNTVGTVLRISPEFSVEFTPFLLTDTISLNAILTLSGYENDKLTDLLAGITMADVITSENGGLNGVTFPVVQTLLSREVAKVIGLFYENEALNDLLGDRRFDDLVKVTGLFEDVTVTFDRFFGTMKFVDILAVANARGRYLNELFGDSTIGTVLSITPEWKVTFTPFRLTDSMSLRTILTIAGIGNDKITALFGDVVLRDIVTSENGGLSGVTFPVVQTLLSREVAKVIGLFYENENLNTLLANRRFDDLVKVNGLFESISVTFDDFFGAMALRDIAAVFAADKVAEGQPLAAILGTTRVGDVISVPSDFRVKISPCALTDDVLLTDVLALFGVKEGKIVALLDQLRGRDVVTINGGNMEVTLIGTVLHFAVADVIGLFYENGKLNDLLGEKRFEDLVQVHGLFENVSFTFNAFFGDMEWTKILALFGLEGMEINELFGGKNINTLLSVNEQYLISFTPYALTDDMHINTILAMAGVHNEKLNALLEDVTLGSIVTSDSKGVRDTRFTAIDTVFSFRLKDIVDLTGVSHQLVDALCTEKTFGSFLSYADGKFAFSFSGLFGDVNVNAVLDGLLSFLGRSLAGWDMVYLFDGYVVTDLINVSDGKLYQGFDKVKDRVTDNKDKILDTIKSSPFSEPSLIYIGAGVVALTVIMATDRGIIMDADIAKTLGFAEDTYLYQLFTGKTLSGLINLSGSDFNSIFTWYDFVSDMKFADILGALRITDERVLRLAGTKDVSTLIKPDGEGSYKITVVEFLGATSMGEIFGEEGYLGLVSDFYLVDLYDLAKGSRDLFTIVSMRMGNRSLYDLAKIVLGRDHERVRIVLGDLKVNSVLIADPDGGYNISFAAVKKIPFGSLFGYTKSTETGKWHDQNGKRVTGVMAAIADMTYSTFDTGIGKIRICEILGYTKGEDNKWYDENGVEVNGLITAFADLSIDDMSDNTKLNDAVNDLTVQQVLGLKQNENGKWTKDGSEVSPFIAALATAKIGNLEDKINKVELGEVAGFIKGEDGNYYEEDTEGNLKPASGVLGEMATLTIEAMKDSNQIVERLQKVRVGYALGYDPVDPSDLDNTQWTDGSGAIVSGILATVVNSRIADIDTAINNAAVGALLGYTETDGVWSKDGKAADGYLSLIGPGTKISELDARVADLKNSATIGQFMDADLLQLDTEAQAKLDRIDTGWRDMTLNGFLGFLLSQLP